MATSHPDLAEYDDLTLQDQDPQDLVDAGRAWLEETVPNIVLREGQPTVVLLETLAQVAAEVIYSINRVPDAVAHRIIGLFGVVRDEGAPPEADLTITVRADPDPDVIPAGTRFLLELGDGLESVVMATTADVQPAADATTVTAASVGDRNTTEANGLPAGTDLGIIDSLWPVDRVQLAEDVHSGRDPESDEAWRDRGIERLSRLVETLVLPDHFTSAALEEADVTRATTVDEYDPDTAGDPGDDSGHVTVAVYGDGVLLSQARRTEIEDMLSESTQANLIVHVIDPTITAVDVTATVVADADADHGEVEQAIIDRLTEFLATANWPWRTFVQRNQLIAEIGAVDGVAYVDTLDAPASTITLPGVAPLTSPGTISVTVT